jgi:glucose-1-phosphate thymidylyltransferase
MKDKGMAFVPGTVDEWLDCGNKDATVYTNKRLLESRKELFSIDHSQFNSGTRIIEPCYIGKNVDLKGSVVGPYVSIGDNSSLNNCVVSNSIIQGNSKLANIECTNSMIGNHVQLDGHSRELSIGDYNTQL